jgi:hypothetical protein
MNFGCVSGLITAVISREMPFDSELSREAGDSGSRRNGAV